METRMTNLIKKGILLSSLILSLNSYAEDIELYIGSASTNSAVKPNILFIVDTSGSMRRDMEIVIPQVVAGPSFTTTTGDLIVHDFNSDSEGWVGLVTNTSNQLRFGNGSEVDVETTQTFDFGVDKANDTMKIRFELYVNKKWDNSDYFEITANGVQISRESYEDDTTSNASAVFNLNASGQVTITLKANTTKENEFARIDNLKIGNEILGTPFGYNDANTYAGCHDKTKIYFGEDAEELSCSDGDGRDNYLEQFINVTDNHCAFLKTNLDSVGHSIGIQGAWFRDRGKNSDKWREMEDVDPGLYDFECFNDRGIHGKNGTAEGPGGDVYAAKRDKGGPWKDNDSNEVDWDEMESENYYAGNYLNYLVCLSPAGCNDVGGTTGDTTTTGTTTTIQQTVTRTRLEVAQYVINDLLSTASNINIGLMRFLGDDGEGGFIVTAVDDIANNKAAFTAELNNLEPGAGGTPLAESLYESYLYYKGLNMHNGISPTGNDGDPATTDPKAHTGNVYNSPIKYQCQKSFVILLTDGKPTNDDDDDDLIEGLPGFTVKTGDDSCSGNCVDEMSEMLFKTDMASSLSRDQLVTTYTILLRDGGNEDVFNLLQSTATKGGGKFYEANSYRDLLSAFTNILNSINEVNSSFVAPALAVNAFSNSSHRNELYYSLFKPEQGPQWGGNVKKFGLKFENGVAVVIDKDGNNAINPQTGFFFKKAQSYWPTASQLEDGGDVTKGGAAAKVIKDRLVYTSIDGNTLTSAGNAVSIANLAALKAKINPTLSDLEATNIIKWARGYDPQDIRGAAPIETARMQMGDSLHSRPVVVQYGGTEAAPIQTIYSSNNNGFLNAIDDQTGALLWSFIPKELLTNLDVLYEDKGSEGKIYGLDGFITVKRVDTADAQGNTGTIGSGDKVVLYIGMRRGGKNYYAVDVTLRDQPKLLWTIEGGKGDFLELAQTWSAPLVKRIKLNGTLKDVLIFGGGYDTNQDSNSIHDDDAIGRAIYIVDADNGERLWWAGPTDSGANLEIASLTNSIPASITAVEFNKKEGVRRLYAADTRGQIFRVDLNIENTGAGNLVSTAYQLAKLSDENSTAGTRRLFYPPKVALMNGYIAVIVGTGYRPQPLDILEQNRIYMIKDVDVFKSPTTVPDPITATDLIDTFILPASKAEQAQRLDDLANSKGWYFNLDVGEKVLSEALITSGVALITSFTPNDGTAALSCSPSSGGGKLYVLDLATSGALQDNNGDGIKTRADTSSYLKSAGLPSQPIIVVDGETGSESIMTTGAPPLPSFRKKSEEKAYWYEDKSGKHVDNSVKNNEE